MKQVVAHYADGRNAWNLGVAGFFMRLRGGLVIGVITMITMGIPWWWPTRGFGDVTLSTTALIVTAALLIGGFFLASLYYLRERSKRSLNVKYILHRIMHDVRDRQTELYSRLLKDGGLTKGQMLKELELLIGQSCENVAHYFQELVGEKSVAVAIRLAVLDSNGGIVYRTVGRSKGLNSNRKKHSEDIPSNVGIPRFLRDEKNSQGVLFYYDLEEAAKLGAYKQTKNDKVHGEDIATMMVAPLNAWSLNQQDMIGILYVTSREKDTFQVKHVDSMAFVADHVAAAISNSIQAVKIKQEYLKLKGR